MPILQLSKFPASDALLADADLIRPLLEPLVKAEGCLSVYYGLEVDAPKKIALIGAEFESLEQSTAAVAGPTSSALHEGLKPFMAGQMETVHIAAKNSPTTAFEAPITEAHFCTLKASGEHNREAFVKFANNGEAFIESTIVSGLHFPVSWGECQPLSSPTSLCGVIGFDNLEVADKFRTEDPGNLLVKAKEIADLKSYRVEYKKVTP